MRPGYRLSAAALFALTAACAKPSLYQSWGQQMVDAPRHNARLEDISLLLGSPPSRCDPIDQPYPVIGASINPKKPVVDAVQPGSPAHQAGLQPGDVVARVGGEATAKPDQVLAAIRRHARPGEPLELETNRGSVLPIPAVPKAEQCYWELHAGEIARAGGAAYVNQWGGSAGAGSSAYQRFFRASCRIHDGFVAGCQANWQE